MKKQRKTAKSTRSKNKAKVGARPMSKSRAASRPRARRRTTLQASAKATAPRTIKALVKKPVRATAKLAARVFARSASRARGQTQPAPAERLMPKIAARPAMPSKGKLPRAQATRAARPAPVSRNVNRHLLRISRSPQFTYMKAPGPDSGFNVGDSVEVFCDHEKESERVRGWIKGVVVQVDNKLVAVQFRSNVFLTDGWMVPDRILWYALASDQIRGTVLGKKAPRKAIPDY